MSDYPAAASLRCEAISKVFTGKSGETEALRSINLEVAAGEFLAITGPSGCGKSTLLQIMAGLMPASSGRVMLGDTVVTEPPAQIVYLFQQYSKSLYPWLTVERNVMFGFQHRAKTQEGRLLNAAESKTRCIEYLEMVGLADFSSHYPWQLSGGMQQRVAIARALAAEPSILLLDEPFSSVDALTRIDLHALILELWTRKKFTVVLVTHDADEAVLLADRIAVLTQRPAVIAEIMDTDIPRPRDPVDTKEAAQFLKIRHRLLDRLLARTPK
ncbi:MAG: ABC transporter ATP-binding protein [Burkholderiales bacterium]